jgi:hypothetical protein
MNGTKHKNPLATTFVLVFCICIGSGCSSSDECVSVSCRDKNAECGAIYGGCGETIRCGECSEEIQCNNNRCSGERERFCVEGRAECGSIVQNGREINCGSCTLPLTCDEGDAGFLVGAECVYPGE